jgi:hypothetical protein
MINKAFDQINKFDILDLISNEVREGRTLDYKERLPGGSDSEKTEFLADVSSFANTAGGYILYGIREKRENGQPTGVAERADGLGGVNPDSEILRLEAIIRTGSDPRIPGIRTRAIEGFDNGLILLMWIPKSWSSPHMVTYKNHSRFYSRSSNGKYALDVSEIRAAFSIAEGLSDKIRIFRDSRLDHIRANNAPVSLEPLPKLVLHLVPSSSFNLVHQIDFAEMYKQRQQLESIASGMTSHRINFDGIVTFHYDTSPQKCCAYVQAFRNGIIEAVETAEFGEQDGRKFIRSRSLERDLISASSRFLIFQNLLNIAPPIVLMISLIDVEGFTMATSSRQGGHLSHRIDRAILILPEVIVEDYGSDLSAILQPGFDAIWQAAGFLRSENYDSHGNWKLTAR